MKKNISLLAFVVLNSVAMEGPPPLITMDDESSKQPEWTQGPLFNRELLRDLSRVNRELKQIEFNDVQFQSSDRKIISGLYKKVENADATLVVHPGWPGKKEQAGPFAAMFADQKWNMLFYDERAKKIGPSLIKARQRYGKQEYNDLYAAIKYAHDQEPNKPIVLLFVCAGGFIGLQALKEIEDEQLRRYKVKAVIADSIWYSLINTVASSASFAVQKKLSNFSVCVPICRTAVGTGLSTCIKGCGTCIGYNPDVLAYAKKIKTPTLFLHNPGDEVIPMDQSKKIARVMQSAGGTVQEVEPEDTKIPHAQMRLQAPEWYKNQVTQFVKEQLKKNE